MEKTLVFIDDGYLSKISKRFGNGKHIKVDIFEFATTLAKEQKLWVEGVYIYVVPPFQNVPPTTDEHFRLEKHKNLYIP